MENKVKSMQESVQELLSVGNEAQGRSEELMSLLNLDKEFPDAVAAVKMGLSFVQKNKSEREMATMLWIRFTLFPAILEKAAQNVTYVTLPFPNYCNIEVLNNFLASKSTSKEDQKKNKEAGKNEAVAEYYIREENGKVCISWVGTNC